MLKQYFKQAIQNLRENQLTSMISILGTMLSVAMILVVVLQFQIKLAGYSPVSKRDRTLSILSASSSAKDGSENNNTGVSLEVGRACLLPLKNAETVCLSSPSSSVITLPGKKLFNEYKVLFTDPAFWKIFDFHFVSGHPFSEADFQSGIPNVVISDYLALSLFNSTDVVGRDILLNGAMNCQVAGVAIRPSKAASETFADVWAPYTANSGLLSGWGCEGMCGSFSAYILAPDASTFAAIGQEIQQNVARYNAGKVDYQLTIAPPLTNVDRALGNYGNLSEPRLGWADYLKSTGLVLLFLILVPTLNLTSLIQSAVQKRRPEMGLRKAFGATGGRLFAQVICENLVVTLIGGVAGVFLSVALLYFGRSFLLPEADTLITFDMIFQPLLFGSALFLTLLLNLLAAGIPALRASRSEIVESLKDENK